MAATLNVIFNFQHTNDIILMICILAVAKKIISTVFSVVNAIKFPFNAFYGKIMFGGHLESEAWEHHRLSVFGLVNAPEVPPFD